ncbi:hypothetical protein Tco_0444699 [Tanacetum coccineum]
MNGDFPPVARNKVTQVLEEYESVFMCKKAKDIWQSLLITHQGNIQVKNNRIDLLVQQYEQFTILQEDSIDSGFARFNTIITSLKALDEGFSSKNYERHASGHVFRPGPIWGCDRLVSRAKVIENQVMAFSVILVSLDSSEDSVGTLAGRVILFGTIPTTILDTTPVITPHTTQTDTTVIPTETPIIAPTIPPSPDYTPTSPDYSPASDSESDPSSDHIPPLPATSPFLSSNDDTIDSDTPDTPPSPTYGTPFTEITSYTQRSPVIPRRRVMILAHG